MDSILILSLWKGHSWKYMPELPVEHWRYGFHSISLFRILFQAGFAPMKNYFASQIKRLQLRPMVSAKDTSVWRRASHSSKKLQLIHTSGTYFH